MNILGGGMRVGWGVGFGLGFLYFFEYLIVYFYHYIQPWSLRLSSAHSASGKSTPEEVLDTSPRTADLSSSSASGPETFL